MSALLIFSIAVIIHHQITPIPSQRQQTSHVHREDTRYQQQDHSLTT